MAESTVRGSFVWHELLTTDVPAAIAYYQKVVGWKTQPFSADYLMWVAKSGPVGGVVPLPAGQTVPGWLPFIGTPDIDATVQQAQRLGGKVLTPVTEIPDAGRYSVLADPQGTVFGVHWSPKAMTPPSGPPQLGQFSWQELATTDYKAAFDFYRALFGWEKTGEHDMGAMGIYFMFGLNGQALGGMYNKPAGRPGAWCCYAQVADARKTAKVAAKAGGTILNGPMQVPGGSWIVQISDPQGGMHAVVSSEPMPAAASAAKPQAEPAAKPASSAAAPVKKASAKKVAKKSAVSTPAAKPKQAAQKKSAKKAGSKASRKASKKISKKASKKVSKKVMRKSATKQKAAKKKIAAKKVQRSAKRKVAKKKAAKKK